MFFRESNLDRPFHKTYRAGLFCLGFDNLDLQAFASFTLVELISELQCEELRTKSWTDVTILPHLRGFLLWNLSSALCIVSCLDGRQKFGSFRCRQTDSANPLKKKT